MYWVLLNLNYVSFHFGIQNYNFLHKGYGISVTMVTGAEIHISYFSSKLIKLSITLVYFINVVEIGILMIVCHLADHPGDILKI